MYSTWVIPQILDKPQKLEMDIQTNTLAYSATVSLRGKINVLWGWHPGLVL